VPGYILIVDIFGLVLMVIGFVMAFRQDTARRVLGRPPRPPSLRGRHQDSDDPLTYILRIAGTMIMVFGAAIAVMVTLFHLA
jgi:uncharacterized protein YjeT (DUF2065 family)